LITRTKELFGKLEKLKGEHEDGVYVSAQTISAANLRAALAKFLLSVATAEGMTKN
jgi:hypothetical protein